MQRQRGFTLLELMIVVVIIGIIAAWGWPQYQNYVRAARRTDGMNALQTVQNRLEKYFALCNTYTTNAGGAWPLALGAANPCAAPGVGLGLNPPAEIAVATMRSSEGHYRITIIADNVVPGCVATLPPAIPPAPANTAIMCGHTLYANPGPNPVPGVGASGAGTSGSQADDGALLLDGRGVRQWDRLNNGSFSDSWSKWR